MKQLLQWLTARGKCTAYGHDMKPGRFFYPPTKSKVSGHVCERCGKTQLLKYRWQA